jgi:hypothetical protein
MSTPESPVVPFVFLLPTAPTCENILASRESVTIEIVAWAKRLIMRKSFSEKELEDLLEAVRAAGRAEGYAKAKLEMALERASLPSGLSETGETADGDDSARPKADKVEILRDQARQIEAKETYTTRTTVTMTKTIALDYLKSAAPRIVGPSEIIKNTKKTLNVFISFGTLNRAMEQLVDAGEAEQTEPSRWRYKGRVDAVQFKSVK